VSSQIRTLNQGSLTEGDGSVQMNSLFVNRLLFILKILFMFLYETNYLNEEVKCIKPPPFVCIPCHNVLRKICLASKSDLGRTTKCDKIHYNLFISKAAATDELLFNRPALDDTYPSGILEQ
jgi:hypothetical protein